MLLCSLTLIAVSCRRDGRAWHLGSGRFDVLCTLLVLRAPDTVLLWEDKEGPGWMQTIFECSHLAWTICSSHDCGVVVAGLLRNLG